MEVEARLPLLYRWDRIEVAQQRDEGIVRTIRLKEQNIGDLELALRYQLNRARGQQPIWIANLRVKSDTGKSPFEVGFDDFGVATGLATGSGFWGVQPGISFLLPSDPAVIYGSLGYLYHIPRDIDRNIGGAFIGRVDPGDAISGNIGFGFALNPRFSFSLGYKHSYIFPTKTEIGAGIERSNRAQVGAMVMGMSYRLSERQSVNFGFEFGATADAPDVSVTLRFPLGVDLRKEKSSTAASGNGSAAALP
ncbi:MAG: transporter [Sphingopyxis sp.]|nr:transporter [Sphingopyxis sp.]